MMKIVELREKARQALGSRFDLKAFHDVILGSGPLPMPVLEENVVAWIEARAATPAAAVLCESASNPRIRDELADFARLPPLKSQGRPRTSWGAGGMAMTCTDGFKVLRGSQWVLAGVLACIAATAGRELRPIQGISIFPRSAHPRR